MSDGTTRSTHHVHAHHEIERSSAIRSVTSTANVMGSRSGRSRLWHITSSSSAYPSRMNGFSVKRRSTDAGCTPPSVQSRKNRL